MKRHISIFAVLAVIVCTSIESKAQNIQLHYDLGRNLVTSTVEMFRPDKAGSTYFFVDFDYSPEISSAYWEITRELCFWQESKLKWLSIHLEYSGGLSSKEGSYLNGYMGGLTYSGNSKDWSKTWSLSVMYKANPGSLDATGQCQMHNFLITGVWNLYFLKNWISFDGFFDFGREVKPWLGTKFYFISEPQLWVNLKNIKGWEKVNLSLGTEVEISCNYVGKGFYAIPTLSAKWTF